MQMPYKMEGVDEEEKESAHTERWKLLKCSAMYFQRMESRKRLVCSNCDEIFTNNAYFKSHSDYCNRSNTFRCELCDIVFNSKYDRLAHQRSIEHQRNILAGRASGVSQPRSLQPSPVSAQPDNIFPAISRNVSEEFTISPPTLETNIHDETDEPFQQSKADKLVAGFIASENPTITVTFFQHMMKFFSKLAADPSIPLSSWPMSIPDALPLHEVRLEV